MVSMYFLSRSDESSGNLCSAQHTCIVSASNFAAALALSFRPLLLCNCASTGAALQPIPFTHRSSAEARLSCRVNSGPRRPGLLRRLCIPCLSGRGYTRGDPISGGRPLCASLVTFCATRKSPVGDTFPPPPAGAVTELLCGEIKPNPYISARSRTGRTIYRNPSPPSSGVIRQGAMPEASSTCTLEAGICRSASMR